MADSNHDEDKPLPHIKSVSRVKHIILEKYLPSWAAILGSANRRLNYFDCFAGPGRYEFSGDAVHGSPSIAVSAGKQFASTRPGHQLNVVLTEKDTEQKEDLARRLAELKPYPLNLHVEVLNEDSETYIRELLSRIRTLAPSFFMIDPYWHPLAIPVINDILSRQRTEVLITLMWYQINRDLANPMVQPRIDQLFGHNDWRTEPFMRLKGTAREHAFVDYFSSNLNAKYVLPFRIGFDPEDNIKGERTKYYLLHASNHPRAALLMKEVMYPLGDEAGTFRFAADQRVPLISNTPDISELRIAVTTFFSGRELSFDEIREQTWQLPFVEKHYREVIQKLRTEGVVNVIPVSSKRGGISRKDLVRFK